MLTMFPEETMFMNETNETKFTNDHHSGMSIGGWFVYSVMIVIKVAALSMSLRRNNGFHFGSFLVAFIFPWLYLIYAMSVPIKSRTPRNSKTRKSR